MRTNEYKYKVNMIPKLLLKESYSGKHRTTQCTIGTLLKTLDLYELREGTYKGFPMYIELKGYCRRYVEVAERIIKEYCVILNEKNISSNEMEKIYKSSGYIIPLEIIPKIKLKPVSKKRHYIYCFDDNTLKRVFFDYKKKKLVEDHIYGNNENSVLKNKPSFIRWAENSIFLSENSFSDDIYGNLNLSNMKFTEIYEGLKRTINKMELINLNKEDSTSILKLSIGGEPVEYELKDDDVYKLLKYKSSRGNIVKF